MRLLGDLAGTVDSEFLMAASYHGGNADAPSPTMAGLKGKRMIVASEIEQRARWAESKLKKLTGSDKIKGRHLNREPIEFEPTHKLWIFGNHKPAVADTTHGFWRRMHLIGWNVTIDKDRIDRNLPDKLATELPGILNWALEGLQEWWQYGLPAPASVEAAVDNYKKESDIVQQFVESECITGEGLKDTPANLYIAFKAWCQQQGEKAAYSYSQAALGRRLTELGYPSIQNSKYKEGIQLQFGGE
jgi:putative DNA primase/helicase